MRSIADPFHEMRATASVDDGDVITREIGWTVTQPTYEGFLHNVAFPDQLLTLDSRSGKVVGNPAISGPESRYQIWRIIPVSPGDEPESRSEGYRALWNVGGGVYVTVIDHSSVISTSSHLYKWFTIQYGSDIGFQVYDGPTVELPSPDPGTPVELVLNPGELKPQELWNQSNPTSGAV